MVISYSTCQEEEKECMWVKYLIYAVLSQFQICRILRIFSAKSVFQKFQSSQKNGFFQVCPPTILDNKALCQQLWVVQHHQQDPSCSALTNPTPSPMLLFYPFKIMSTHAHSFIIRPYANNYELSHTTNNIMATVHQPILHHHRCPSRSALTNPTAPPMLLY